MSSPSTQPSAQQQPVATVARSVDAIVNDVWSPSELHVLDPNCDVLAASLPPLSVPLTRAHAVRLSLITAPFETLHAKWRPAASTVSREAELGDSLRGATLASAKMTWSSRDAQGSECIVAEQCKKSFWVRLTTKVGTRSFIVERSPAHMATLVSAVQYTFPQLLVPAASVPTAPLAGLLCEFFQRNVKQLACYLPALYFFFEGQEKVANMFFGTLDGALRARRAQEAALFDSLRPKVSKGWFSWGGGSSSKGGGDQESAAGVNADQGDSLADTIRFIDSQSSTVPPCVKPAYLTALSRSEQFANLVSKAHALKSSFTESAEALMGVATGAAVSPQTNEPVQGWYSAEEQELVAEAKTSAAEMKRTAGCLQQMVFVAASLKCEVGEPVLSAIVEVVEQAAIVAASRQLYLEAYLAMKRVVVDSAPFLSGKVPLVKGCAAASNPAQLQQVTALHQWYCHRLSMLEKCIEKEIGEASGALRSLERKICLFFVTAVFSQLEGYDERHHEQLVTSFSAQGGPAAQSLRELFQPSESPKPDDIVRM